MIRGLLFVACLALAAASLAGCGQKGPLKLPESPPPKAAEPK